MQFNRVRLSHRNMQLYSHAKVKTGLSINILARFGICLSLKDPSMPNPEEYDEKGMEILPATLFGEHENLFKALLIQRLEGEGLDPESDLQEMLRAHVNRGAPSLYSRINNITNFYEVIEHESKCLM